MPHDQKALAKALEDVLREGAELIIVFGASAIADRRDVIPAAVEAIGGKVEHFGMPVDPGNLLLLADARGRPLLGAPGCARSPKENGFDWILMRLLAGLEVPREAITGLGVGGLLMEIVTRPQPRDEPVAAGDHHIAAVVLAAGRSTRMGGPNKLLAEIGGKPLVRIAAEHALASRASPVIVVTGHQHEKVKAALADLPVRIMHNPDFASGLGSSLRTGVAAVPPEADGVIVCLGDMPQVDAALIDRLIGAFDPEMGALVVVPVIDGERGNPVLWSRRFFPDLMAIEGDIGARKLIGRYGEVVAEVSVTGKARFHRYRHAGGAARTEGRDRRCLTLPAPARFTNLKRLPGSLEKFLGGGVHVHAWTACRARYRRGRDSTCRYRCRRGSGCVGYRYLRRLWLCLRLFPHRRRREGGDAQVHGERLPGGHSDEEELRSVRRGPEERLRRLWLRIRRTARRWRRTRRSSSATAMAARNASSAPLPATARASFFNRLAWICCRGGNAVGARASIFH